MSEWQPIETALQKDGERIIGAHEPNGFVGEYVYRHGAFIHVVAAKMLARTGSSGEYFAPTHWMPLPEPPDCKSLVKLENQAIDE